MELNFSKINGTNAHLNYDTLRESIIEKLSPTCNNAEVIILNNFPVPVSAQSTIDFIILINIHKQNKSWYEVEIDDDKVNVKNQIIAVSVLDDYRNSAIKIDDNQIEINGEYLDFTDDASKMKWGLTNYLANYCNLARNKITIHPLFWVKNNDNQSFLSNVVIGNEFNYQVIEDVIKLNYFFKWQGYSDWYETNSLFDQNVRGIFEQASRDSATGYLTKNKILRIQNSLDKASQKAYDNIGEKLVEVRGKAGTGKSSDILKWMLQLSLKERRGVFLTYNHLLVFDISSQIQSFYNQLSSENRKDKKSTTTYTIHSYFYHLARKLGVLLLLSDKRITELRFILDSRWEIIETYFDSVRNEESSISLRKLLMYVQTKFKADEGTKREAVYFLQYIDKIKFLDTKENIKISFNDYRKEKIGKLADLESSNVFLTDYNKVLERIFQATSNLDGFIKELDVTNKFQLLAEVMDLKESILEQNGSRRIDLDKLKTRYKKSLGGFRGGRIVYVDEAQDCHPYERDIIFNLFGSSNTVIANGDKEQLIRYSQLCDWHISQGKNIDFYKYLKKRKSYRMKPAIAALANHIASYFDIDLNVEPLDTDDHGNIIIDTNSTKEQQINYINSYSTIGMRQGCTSYESLLLLRKPQKNSNQIETSSKDSSVIVNEFDNIISSKNQDRNKWELLDKASSQVNDFRFWDATGNVDKREMSVPGALSVRSIYYASCRGIEAWSVMCFNIDGFFESKTKENEADNYLLNNLFDQLTPEKRRKMYAATWVLMAITRCIENCYLELKDPNSSLFKCILDFKNKYPNYVSIKE